MPGMSTQPQIQIPLKQIPMNKKSGQKVFVGEVFITKCKFVDNKAHGVHLQNIY